MDNEPAKMVFPFFFFLEFDMDEYKYNFKIIRDRRNVHNTWI